MPTPKPAVQEINDRLKKIQRRGRLIARESTEFLSIERDARKLLKVDAGNGYSVLGSLCSLAGDVEGLHENYSKAQKLSSDPLHSCNYAISLANLGYFSEAIQKIAVCERPENGRLEKAILLNVEAGRFRRAVELIQKWNNLHQDCPWVANNFSEVANILSRANIGDEGLLPCLDVVGKTLRDNQLIFIGEPVINVINESGWESVSFRFLISASPKLAASVEAALVDQLFDANINLHESFVRFGLAAAEELEKQVA